MSGNVPVAMSNAPVEEAKTEEKPKPLPWPKRQRPQNNYDAALAFIAAVITAMNKNGEKLTSRNVDVVDKYFRAYCWNTGLRGKQKESIWRIIKAQIIEVKAEAKDKDAEL